MAVYDLVQMDRERCFTSLEESDVVSVLQAVLREREVRPGVLAAVERFPQVCCEYLRLSEGNKEELAGFHFSNRDYMFGGWYGDCIRGLDGNKYAGFVARKARYASQLQKIFDFYVEHTRAGGERGLFNRSYMLFDEELRRRKGALGIQLCSSVKKSHLSLQEIVDIVADVRPQIKSLYMAPERQYEKRGRNVKDLRRG
jgi:hypothetical protein